MGIRSMVEESLGYVTPQDRAALHSMENSIQQEKQDAQKGVLNSSVATAAHLGEQVLQGKITGEATSDATHRRGKKKVTTTKVYQEVKDADDLGEDYNPDDDPQFG